MSKNFKIATQKALADGGHSCVAVLKLLDSFQISCMAANHFF